MLGHQDVITGDTISIGGTNYLVRQAANLGAPHNGRGFHATDLEEVSE